MNIIIVILIIKVDVVVVIIIVIIVRRGVEKVSTSNQDSFAGKWENFGLNNSRSLQLSLNLCRNYTFSSCSTKADFDKKFTRFYPRTLPTLPLPDYNHFHPNFLPLHISSCYNRDCRFQKRSRSSQIFTRTMSL